MERIGAKVGTGQRQKDFPGVFWKAHPSKVALSLMDS